MGYYYLTGYHYCTESISEFLIFNDHDNATDETVRLDRENRRQQVSCEMFTVTYAHDLWTLVIMRPDVFRTAQSRNISQCYFCRAHIPEIFPTDTSSVPRHCEEELQHLVSEALTHGHCLWCHRPYRRGLGDSGDRKRDEGRHLKFCQVLCDLREVDT